LDKPNSIPIKANTLTGIKLFRELSEKDRVRIASHCQGRIFHPEDYIVTQEEHSRDVYFIISGEVRAIYFSTSGKQISFREQYAGEMFGELSAIDGKARSADIMALTDVSLAIMSAEDFKDLLAENALLSFEVMQHLTNLVRLLSERVIEFTALAVKNRIQAELLRLSRKAKVEGSRHIISPVPTHGDLANRVSTHREAVTRELKELEKNGILERNHDHWIVVDIERLQQMLTEESAK
jgi:CRP/FNR family transcriptional regulator, cyclic AMP receptor protein